MAGDKSPGSAPRKVARGASSSRSPLLDPDGVPIRFRELLMNKPELIAAMQRHVDRRRLARASKIPPATGASLPSPASKVIRFDESSTAHSNTGQRMASQSSIIGGSQRLSAKLTALQKGKRIAVDNSVDDRHVGSPVKKIRQGDVPAVDLPVRSSRPIMVRPTMEPLRLYRGRSFVKPFTTPFKTSIDVTFEFWKSVPDKRSRSVIIFGDVMMGFEVHVQLVNKVMFTEGWSVFVHYERISRGDVAVFALLGPNTIGMRLYGADGSHKPLVLRPPYGCPLLDDFPVVAANDAPHAGANVPIPNNLLGMVFELGNGILINGAIMQTLANVWHNRDTNFPLFVCNITRSQVGGHGQFYFSSSYSKYLNHDPRTNLFVADSLVAHEALLVRPPRNPDVARIIVGWPAFAAHAALQAGATYVVMVSEEHGAYSVRFYHIGYPAM